MMKILPLMIVVILLSLAVTNNSYAEKFGRPGYHDDSLTHAGKIRTYAIYIPTITMIQQQESLPLVIVLHGGGGNSKNAAQMTGFSQKANTENFIIVYPNGTSRIGKNILLTWNSGNCCGYALDNNMDDVGFIRALIEKLEQELPIDPKRIYATGISNGAMMSYRLGCELSDKIAAIGPVAGALNIEGCKPEHPVSVIIFHGKEDKHVLYNGGRPLRMADKRERIDKPVSYAVSLWTKNNKCSSTPQKEEKGLLMKELYTGGLQGTEVVCYSIKGEGHTWPGGKKGRYIGADNPTHEVSATDLIWEFFKNHPKQ